MNEYPFTALVGQDALKTALCLIAVNPSIGGILIRGERGTAKSTAARALAALLPHLRVTPGCPFNCDPAAPWADCPHCKEFAERTGVEVPAPFVDLPLGATEDRVLGTLDFERALREGRRSFQPGLLASAHRGILYIDEVNLLADHLVDVLLDAAALGMNTVQREGVAVVHPSRFLLIGTMNPEEGDLRPQLLDRFGLMIEVTAAREQGLRVEVVRRRLAFEADPEAFAKSWAGEQQALRERIVAARSCLKQVSVAEDILDLISRICCEFAVDGLRADIVMHKAAQARAAFDGRDRVSTEDVRAAAELVLPHRRRRRPFEQPNLDRYKLNDLLAPPRPPSGNGTADEPPDQGEKSSQQQEQAQPNAAAEQVFGARAPEMLRKIQISASSKPALSHGRRNPAPSTAQGRYERAVLDEKPVALAVDATLRSAVRRGGLDNGTLQVQRSDLHRKERAGKTGTRVLFLVDASGSMATRRRMELVKGVVFRLLEEAYQERDQVGVIAFRGPEAQVLLPFTASVEAAIALRELPTGGRTPLAHALTLAAQVVQQSRQDAPALLIVVSDGKANVPLAGTDGDPWQQALAAAAQLAGMGLTSLVLDSETGFVRSGRARRLAEALAAEYLPLEELSADELVLKIRARKIT
jgi:magnesium chelatase subunit D